MMSRIAGTGWKTGLRIAAAVALLALSARPARGDCGTSAITMSYNATPDKSGFLWFSSSVNVSGMGPGGGTITLDNSAIDFIARVPFHVAVPGGVIRFDPASASASTAFNSALNRWETVVPADFSGSVFLSGVALPIPPGGIKGGNNPMTWSGRFSSDSPDAAVTWQWVVSSFGNLPNPPSPADYNALNVRPVDDASMGLKAGAPACCQSSLQHKTSYSAAAGVSACILPSHSSEDLAVANRLTPAQQNCQDPNKPNTCPATSRASSLSYVITVTSTDAASGVVVTFQMPSGIGIVAADPPCTGNASVACALSGGTVLDDGTVSGGTVTATLPAFTGNGFVQFTVSAIAPSTPGFYTTTASVISSTPESDLSKDLSNNSSQATISVQ